MTTAPALPPLPTGTWRRPADRGARPGGHPGIRPVPMPARLGLTVGQARVMTALRGFIAARGHSPTVTQLAALTGRSKSGMTQMLDRLADRGHIVRVKGVVSSITLPEYAGTQSGHRY